MDKNEIKSKIESMLAYIKDSVNEPYQDKKTCIILNAKIDVLEDVLELFN